LRAIHYYIYGTHQDLEPILTFPKGRNWLPGEWETHLNLPKGKELVPDERDEGEWGEGNERLLTGGKSWCPSVYKAIETEKNNNHIKYE